ncbi:archaellum operon transcriptional activator EarA family protein [Sulfurisphaera ohwakuensis]|uniref:Putative transcriptional regulator with HTH domain n=1 Tax=Sulfurisphaera ohwakuensis TaxID=69656 RepID=A0A7J9RY62_SULOH|nr:archaellum operon transcriptional activator EarA family protein [Sulfurisphaera ohwakuensis]MBB5255192.1 putative transcriptional regulator with HTH domain [Sulfurisphaera ohwakuensis]
MRKSKIRLEILKVLRECYPNSLYIAKIARRTGVNITQVIGALRGINNKQYKPEYSLLSLGLVYESISGNRKLYKISPKGILILSYLESQRYNNERNY